MVPVPAAILAGPQSNRDGLLKAENTDPEGRSQDLRPTLANSRVCLQLVLGRRMLQLLQSRRV